MMKRKATQTTPKIGDLRVWHTPQIPGKSFLSPVASVDEGRRLCAILADYDRFQFANRIKPDYFNANGVERFEDDGDGGGEWCDVDPDEDDYVTGGIASTG